MALINCCECGKQISDQAKNCPDCGYPISSEKNVTDVKDETATNPPTVVVKQKEGCFLQTLNVGCMILFVIIVLLILFFVIVFSS